MTTSVPNADGSTPPSGSSPAVPRHPTNIGPNASNVPIAVAVPTEDGGRGRDANRLTEPDYEAATFGPHFKLMKKEKEEGRSQPQPEMPLPLPPPQEAMATRPAVKVPREQQQHQDERHRPSDFLQSHDEAVREAQWISKNTRRGRERNNAPPLLGGSRGAPYSAAQPEETTTFTFSVINPDGSIAVKTVRRTRNGVDRDEMDEVLASTTVSPGEGEEENEDEDKDEEEGEGEDEVPPPPLERSLSLRAKGNKRKFFATAMAGAMVGAGVALAVMFGTRRQTSPSIPHSFSSETTNTEMLGGGIFEQCVLKGDNIHCRSMLASVMAETETGDDGDEKTKDDDGLFLCVDSDPGKNQCRAWIQPFEFPVAAADDVVRGRRGRQQQQQGKRRAAISPVNQVGACCETCAPCPEGCEREWAFDCSNAISGAVGRCGKCREEGMSSLQQSSSPSPSLSPSLSPSASRPSRPPSTETTPRPTEKVVNLRHARATAAANSVSSEEALSDPTSPQSLALSWLVSKDSYPFASYSPPADSDSYVNDGVDDYFVVQRYIMALMYFAWDGPNWARSTNYLSVEISECDWFGLTCEMGKITHIKYGKRTKLKGTFLEELTALVHLKDIIVPNHEIGGSLPETLARLKRLKVLGLGGNQITGIPDSLGGLEELEGLHLWGNSIQGTVPHSLGLLAKLEKLDLSNNLLAGSIPPSLGSLMSIENLDLGNNDLNGTIPTSLENLNSLVSLSLSDNQFHGSVPDIFDNLRRLEEVNLRGNAFSGSVPESIGTLYGLKRLDLRSNRFEGQVLESLGALTKLEYLNLAYNQLNGSVPDIFDNLPFLEEVYLYDNEFSGLVPESIGALNRLKRFSLTSNRFEGQVPESLGTLSNLKFLSLAHNHFNGSIPASFENLLSLEDLWMYNNSFSGTLPASLGKLEKLKKLLLWRNQLTGSVPQAFGDLYNLVTLSLQQNKLVGSIPSTLGNLAFLESLYLYNNNITGIVPTSVCDLTVVSLKNLEADCDGYPLKVLCSCCTECHFPYA